MVDIDYGRCNVSRRIREEIIAKKGERFWEALSVDLTVPTDDMEGQQCSACMRAFMQRFQRLAPPNEIKAIMVNVRHDLSSADFGWAVRMYREAGDIDRFADALQRMQVGEILDCFSRGEKFYGMVVDQEVVDRVNAMPNIFYGRRYGSEILAEAIPANLYELLHAKDDAHRRYHACHCIFARESILQQEGPVSDLLCECSLGHTMALWEAVLGRKLEGEVVESALKGDQRCLFRIKLPEEVCQTD